MLGNNSSGCGCLLWFIDSIVNSFRKKRISKFNKQARGVEVHQSTATTALFPPHSYRDSIIISGGGQGERLNVCETILRNAFNAKHSVVILHAADGAMEKLIASNGFGMVISSRSKKLDAFTGFDFDEIVQVVVDTCKSKYDIKPAGRYILQVAYELLISLGRLPYFSAFAKCPYFKLNDQIAAQLRKGYINQDDADRLTSLLMTGQSECPKIDTFFADMKAQIGYLSAENPADVKAVSIVSAIKNNQIICIDMKATSNTMLMELIVNSLIIAMNRGYDFSLMIDDFSFVNNDLLKNTVCQKANHRNIFVSKDLYALTGGKEDVFATIMGEVDKTVVFGHSSSISCDKVSKYLGEYEKLDVSNNRNVGWFQAGRFGYTTNYGQTETLKREPKVKPEEIHKLSENEAVAYDHSTGSLIHTVIE